MPSESTLSIITYVIGNSCYPFEIAELFTLKGALSVIAKSLIIRLNNEEFRIAFTQPT